MSEAVKTYATRSNARRAAQAACRKALDAPRYCAFEGPDYEIHPENGRGGWGFGPYGVERYSFRLRGPAKESVA